MPCLITTGMGFETVHGWLQLGFLALVIGFGYLLWLAFNQRITRF
jgi:hypothetical protein